MNDVIFIETARKFAERMLLEGAADPLEYGFRLALVRTPNAAEKAVLTETLDRFRKRYAADPKAALEFVSQGDAPRNPKFAPEELAPYAAVASLILNLDELVTKE